MKFLILAPLLAATVKAQTPPQLIWGPQTADRVCIGDLCIIYEGTGTGPVNEDRKVDSFYTPNVYYGGKRMIDNEPSEPHETVQKFVWMNAAKKVLMRIHVYGGRVFSVTSEGPAHIQVANSEIANCKTKIAGDKTFNLEHVMFQCPKADINYENNFLCADIEPGWLQRASGFNPQIHLWMGIETEDDNEAGNMRFEFSYTCDDTINGGKNMDVYGCSYDPDYYTSRWQLLKNDAQECGPISRLHND